LKGAWRLHNPGNFALGRYAGHLAPLRLPPPRTRILQGVRMLSTSGQLFTEDLQCIDAQTLDAAAFNACVGSLQLDRTKLPAEDDDSIVLPLFDDKPWHLAYFHWICDYLPKIIWAERSLGDAKGRLKLLLHTNPQTRAFHLETLRALGYPGERVIEINPARIFPGSRRIYLNLTVRTLLSIGSRYRDSHQGPSEVVPFDQMHPSIITELGQRIRACFAEVPAQGTSRRIYITRRRAGSRRILNEAEILPCLVERGFHIVELETLPFGEQVPCWRRPRW